MPLPATRKAYLQIHLCVILWGFTAILGKLISLTALPLVWWRMLIVVIALAFIPRTWRGLRAMSTRLRLAYAGIGVLVALHWLTFYGAIKLSNASVGVTCLALATPLTALIEPRLTRTRFSWRELLLGLAVIPGVAMVVGGVPVDMHAGIAVGAVSALFVALFGSLNKRLVEHGDAVTVTAIELAAGTVALTILAMPLQRMVAALGGNPFVLPDRHDAVLLLALAIACTLLPFTLSLIALRSMSAFSAQLAINLEPVYAIALAIVLLDEQRELSPMFYAGAAMIIVALFAHPFLVRHPRVSQPELAATAETKTLIE